MENLRIGIMNDYDSKKVLLEIKSNEDVLELSVAEAHELKHMLSNAIIKQENMVI